MFFIYIFLIYFNYVKNQFVYLFFWFKVIILYFVVYFCKKKKKKKVIKYIYICCIYKLEF